MKENERLQLRMLLGQGWPGAKEEKPMPGRDWVFSMVVIWAAVATVIAIAAIATGAPHWTSLCI